MNFFTALAAAYCFSLWQGENAGCFMLFALLLIDKWISTISESLTQEKPNEEEDND